MKAEVVEEEQDERDEEEVRRLQAPDADTLDKAIMAGSSFLSTALPRQYSWFHRRVVTEWHSALGGSKWG